MIWHKGTILSINGEQWRKRTQMIEKLKAEFPTFCSMQESELRVNDQALGWQVTALNSQNKSMSSGFHTDLNQARKIAVAELIERTFVNKVARSSDAEKWRMSEYPSACGFAAGFELAGTKLRSFCEAVERWALSQWIDRSCPLEEITRPEISKIAKVLLSDFVSFRVWSRTFVYISESGPLTLHLCVAMALTEQGAFLGSAVRHNQVEAMDHALVESHRHLLISTQDREFEKFPYDRIQFFAKNRSVAEDIVNQDRRQHWPDLKLKLEKEFEGPFYYVVRTIIEGWEPWTSGSISRMLY